MYESEIEKPRIGFAREHARKAFRECKHLFPEGFPSTIELAYDVLIPGYQVILQENLGDNESGLVIHEAKAIGLNARHAITRRRFTIAHEIGHIRMGHPQLACQPVNTDIGIFETEANAFAGEFLVPLDSLKVMIKTCRDPADLSKRYGVSRDMMLIRLRETKIFNRLF